MSSIKEFIIDKNQIVTPTKRVEYKQHEVEFELTAHNEIDFVLNRKTSKTDTSLVVLVSQGQYYIKNNKNSEVKPVTLMTLRRFLKFYYWGNYGVSWLQEKTDRAPELIMRICDNEGYASLLRMGIYEVSPSIYLTVAKDRPKLLQYFYNTFKGRITPREMLSGELKIAYFLDKEVNFNEAKYFIDCRKDAPVSIYSDFVAEKMEILVKTYRCNPRRLLEYLLFDLYSQGIGMIAYDILNEYVDTLRLQNMYYGKIVDKYPKNLRTFHDIMALRYSKYKDLKDRNIDLSIYYANVDYKYKDATYSIVHPTNSNEIIDEGVNLSHCVATYIKKITDSATHILFMRSEVDTSESLITIEVCDGTLIQAKGMGNRTPNAEEMTFIRKWVKAKNLVSRI